MTAEATYILLLKDLEHVVNRFLPLELEGAPALVDDRLYNFVHDLHNIQQAIFKLAEPPKPGEFAIKRRSNESTKKYYELLAVENLRVNRANKELKSMLIGALNNARALIDNITTFPAMEDELVAEPYGRCPMCGAPGISRERRLDGDDMCAKGHKYPSKAALPGHLVNLGDDKYEQPNRQGGDARISTEREGGA